VEHAIEGSGDSDVWHDDEFEQRELRLDEWVRLERSDLRFFTHGDTYSVGGF
jgi:hypothetical protein